MSKKRDNDDSPRAADLLPPDGPAPVDARSVRPAHASMEPEVETRKVGIRRVSCLDFGNRFYDRANRRPAGNTRRFWRNIEADDPFLKAPARPTDAPLEIYAAQRIERTDGSLPKPQPDVAKAYQDTRKSSPSEAPARPRKEVKRTPKRDTGPEQRHTPEPRPAPTPQPKQVRRPRRDPEPVEEAPKPIDRRPPMPKRQTKSRTGRQRMPSRAQQQEGPRKKTAKEIREEKLRARSGPVEKKRSIDEYRDFMQNMMFMRDKFDAGEEIPVIQDETADKEVRRPKPKGESPREVKRPKKREPKPEPAPPPVDRRPPMPKKKPEAPVDRSIKPGGNAGGLDDLFGGGGDRVRIGRRAKPKAPGEGEE